MVCGAGLRKAPTVTGGGANETNYDLHLFTNAAARSVPKYSSTAKPELEASALAAQT